MGYELKAPFRYTPPAGDLAVSVEGELPADLRGRLLRTTAAGLERGAWQAHHWFDGLCLLYRFDLGETPGKEGKSECGAAS